MHTYAHTGHRHTHWTALKSFIQINLKNQVTIYYQIYYTCIQIIDQFLQEKNTETILEIIPQKAVGPDVLTGGYFYLFSMAI